MSASSSSLASWYRSVRSFFPVDRKLGEYISCTFEPRHALAKIGDITMQSSVHVPKEGGKRVSRRYRLMSSGPQGSPPCRITKKNRCQTGNLLRDSTQFHNLIRRPSHGPALSGHPLNVTAGPANWRVFALNRVTLERRHASRSQPAPRNSSLTVLLTGQGAT